MNELQVGRRTLKVSNLDKVLYPGAGFTKGDVLDYYRDVAETLIPHLKDRPLTLKRYPDGVEAGFFYEKRCPPYRPGWLKTTKVLRKRDKKYIEFCVVNDAASLLWVANLASLELHVSLAKGRAIQKPTSLVFDLDPDPDLGVLGAARVAQWVRAELNTLGLESFPKTSGSKGIQLYVPLNTSVTYAETAPAALAIAKLIEEKHPDDIVTKQSKELRRGRVLIDWSQNDDHKTTVSVYSLRARPTPTVSTPITWRELQSAVRSEDPEKLTFTAPDVLKRIARRGDLFEDVLKLKQKLPEGHASNERRDPKGTGRVPLPDA
ncbi:MAG: non-homologous end-joining DNA ligase [Actinomycetota bacterium]|nr:non-homologous end-joining DNA ligase [Actinomycetota bacterium]